MVAAGLVLLSACGAKSGPAAPIKPAAAQQQQQAQPQQIALSVAEVTGVGEVLTDQNGRTLYLFTKDTKEPSQSTCVDDCAVQWPPLMVSDGMQVTGVDSKLVGQVARPDGSGAQVTVGGWPLYTFAKDTTAGVANGQGVKDVWFAVTPQGKKAGAPKGSALVATDIPGFGQALTDQDGRTLYLFTKDSKNPSESTCDGECAATWPPVLATGDDVKLTGIDPALVGRVARADGTEQVTVGGWPIYRFAKDSAPGQTNGHGVGGTWFVIEAAGCKSKAPVAAPAEQAPAEGGSTGY
jgi:predicted lipoprotein with Yx(FWY)xxD motif